MKSKRQMHFFYWRGEFARLCTKHPTSWKGEFIRPSTKHPTNYGD